MEPIVPRTQQGKLTCGECCVTMLTGADEGMYTRVTGGGGSTSAHLRMFLESDGFTVEKVRVIDASDTAVFIVLVPDNNTEGNHWVVVDNRNRDMLVLDPIDGMTDMVTHTVLPKVQYKSILKINK